MKEMVSPKVMRCYSSQQPSMANHDPLMKRSRSWAALACITIKLQSDRLTCDTNWAPYSSCNAALTRSSTQGRASHDWCNHPMVLGLGPRGLSVPFCYRLVPSHWDLDGPAQNTCGDLNSKHCPPAEPRYLFPFCTIAGFPASCMRNK